MTSRKRLDFEKFTRFIRQIVKCSFEALKTAPINPPRQPIMTKRVNSQIEKFEESPLLRIFSVTQQGQEHETTREMPIVTCKQNIIALTREW